MVVPPEGEWNAMEEELPENYRRLEMALQSPLQVFKDQHHARYHEAQRTQAEGPGSYGDTAAKKSARKTGLDFVVCPCGLSFTAHV